MTCSVFSIVEGHGEVSAVPVLLRRFASEMGIYDLNCFPPHRVPRGKMRDAQFMNKIVEFAGAKISASETQGLILCLLDADDDCPATIGPEILEILSGSWPTIPKSVVAAKYEYENWLIASAESLRDHKRVRNTAISPERPEDIRDAKGYLAREIMLQDAYYSPTVDQPALTSYLDFELARRCASFDKLHRDLSRLFSNFIPQN